LGFRTFIREITNHLGASTECVQKGIAPARREKRRGFLIDEFVCLGKKSRVLAGGGAANSFTVMTKLKSLPFWRFFIE